MNQLNPLSNRVEYSGFGLKRIQMMTNTDKDGEQKDRVSDNGPPLDSARTLLPMLIGGLSLTIVALIVVVLLV